MSATTILAPFATGDFTAFPAGDEIAKEGNRIATLSFDGEPDNSNETKFEGGVVARLLVHRVVHAFLDGDTAALDALRDDITGIVRHVTEASGRAARMELGFVRHAATTVFGAESSQTLEAVISGFGPKNAFVSVIESGLSGTLPFAAIPGRWETDTRRVSALEPASGNVMRIGDRVKVTVAGVEEAAASVSFARTSRRS